jgi:LPXTG-site transpeptidase (sortase) family protein
LAPKSRIYLAGILALAFLAGCNRGEIAQSTSVSSTLPTSRAVTPASTKVAGFPTRLAPTGTLVPNPRQTPQPEVSLEAQSSVSETIGRIQIPNLALDVPIVEVSWHLEEIEGQTVGVWDTVAGMAGHHRGTAALGAQGNCVISGHSQAAAQGVFQLLAELKPGDKITLLTAEGSPYQYIVEGTQKVAELGVDLEQRRAHATVMAPTQDARLTLITCWPDWAYTHRLIVSARLALP